MVRVCERVRPVVKVPFKDSAVLTVPVGAGEVFRLPARFVAAASFLPLAVLLNLALVASTPVATNNQPSLQHFHSKTRTPLKSILGLNPVVFYFIQ